MGRYKVGVYAICKNEEKFVDKWMDSMGEADIIVVTDTGSEDGTVERLRERGAEVYVEKIDPWRFDVARNLSLEHMPEDVDICVCTDLDELFETGWREKLESAWESQLPEDWKNYAVTGRYLYNWSLKPDGTPDVQFNYFKVHSRNGYRWRCPVHEYLSCEGKTGERKIFINGMVLNHYPDPTKSRGSYLSLLELAVEEAPDDERMRYYLGREYMYKGRRQDCVDTLTAFLKMPNARWNEERCAAMRWIADSFYHLGQEGDAYRWYYRAIAEAPHMRDPYVEFARFCYRLSDWPTAFFLGEEALKIKEKSKTYVNMGYSWDHTPNDICAIAGYNMNLKVKALKHAELALELNKDDKRLRRNLELIQSSIRV